MTTGALVLVVVEAAYDRSKIARGPPITAMVAQPKHHRNAFRRV